MATRLRIRNIDIPFKLAFSHASAERSRTQAVLVTATGDNGMRGFGEGCPREYVTGESLATVHAFFMRHQKQARDISDLEGLYRYLAEHKSDIDANPAAWCAMEMALMDLLARQRRQSLEAFLGLPELAGSYHYSAVLGTDNIGVFASLLQMYLGQGMTDLKVKLTGDLETDLQKTALLSEHGGEQLRIRFDANNCWHDGDAAAEYLQALASPFWAVEEPLAPCSYSELEMLAGTLNTKIILDESLVRLEQVDELMMNPSAWVINLRVSKMGGLLRSLALIDTARERNVPLIIGAQVGETSLLTRAGLLVAQVSRNNLLAQEGAFGTYLLEDDICEPCLMFGGHGELKAERCSFQADAGSGLTVQ